MGAQVIHSSFPLDDESADTEPTEAFTGSGTKRAILIEEESPEEEAKRLEEEKRRRAEEDRARQEEADRLVREAAEMVYGELAKKRWKEQHEMMAQMKEMEEELKRLDKQEEEHMKKIEQKRRELEEKIRAQQLEQRESQQEQEKALEQEQPQTPPPPPPPQKSGSERLLEIALKSHPTAEEDEWLQKELKKLDGKALRELLEAMKRVDKKS
jgi:hypothetical protein